MPTLAKHFDGYSASDIKDVCQGAQLLGSKRIIQIIQVSHEPIEGQTPPQDPRETNHD